MRPTINRDFTAKQIAQHRENRKSRKGGEINKMQCLHWNSEHQLIKVTVWQLSIVDRLRLLLTGKCYLTMTGTPMVWLDVQKPYNTNELIQNIDKPKQPETAGKKTVTPVGGLDALAVNVKQRQNE